MNLTHELSESLPQHLGDIANVLEEVIVVDGFSLEDDEVDDVDEEEEQSEMIQKQILKMMMFKFNTIRVKKIVIVRMMTRASMKTMDDNSIWNVHV